MKNISFDFSHKQAMARLSPKTSKNLLVFPQLISDFLPGQCPYTLTVLWHGLAVKLNLQNKAFYQELKNYFPVHWQKQTANIDLDLFIVDPTKANIASHFWQDNSADCYTYVEENREWACQRDFLAVRSKKKVFSVCENNVADGFFNLMRWLLPRNWLAKNMFLFHSSCVIDKQNNAYLCLGPSGAGKTTIAQFLPQNQVLGDDMNMVQWGKDGKLYVTPSLLGQKYEDYSLFGHSFLLKNIYWLKKSKVNQVSRQHNLSFNLKICSSLVNIFWKDLSAFDYKKIQTMISLMTKNFVLKELSFSKTSTNPWEDIFESNANN